MEFFIAIALYVLPSSITPGPNNLMILSSGLNHGIRKTLPHYLGVITGFPLMIIGIGLGLSTLFTSYPILHVVIKYTGFAYLCFMAYKIAKSNSGSLASEKVEPFTYLQATLFQWVNPKAWVMGVTAVSTYTTHGNAFISEVITIALTYMILGGSCVAVWLFGGALLTGLFKEQKHLVLFNYSMAIFLVLSLVPVFFLSE